MRQVAINYGGHTFFMDPLNRYKGIDPKRLFEVMGLLPHFLVDGVKTTPDDDIHKIMDDRYQHGGGLYKLDMTFNNGILQYEGDPDMWPISLFRHNDEDVWFYEGGYIAIVSDQGAFVARMD